MIHGCPNCAPGIPCGCREPVEHSKCELCGEPMPPGEEMFKYHGYSGDCPKPPLPEATVGGLASEQPSREGAVKLPEAIERLVRVYSRQNGVLSIAHAEACFLEVAEAAYRAGQEAALDVNEGRGLELVNFGAAEMAAQIRRAIESGGRFSDENANWILDHCAPTVPPAGEQP